MPTERWNRLATGLALLFLLCSCGSADKADQADNRLATASSPYLQQHANNPVHWQPWDASALQQARKENKLILISIGYAACHWCHVMEEESFMDTTVARLMNDHFVNIKVDREERPDVDAVYLSACQLTNETGCGWPLNAIALPDGRPVFVGTYFPREEWLNVLAYFSDAWPKQKREMESFADRLAEGVQSLYPSLQAAEAPGKAAIAYLRAGLLKNRDPKHGGRAGTPKFPIPAVATFLLHEHALKGGQESLRAVQLQLDQMAKGGIYDQLAGGFARYATDAQWRIPHFEKMLYDNAQLARLYAQAWQVTGKARYREVAENTLEWMLRDLADGNGFFYSSLDADTDGEEGRYYTWTLQEWEEALPDSPEWLAKFYGLSREGNFEAGRNVLYRAFSLSALAEKTGLEKSEGQTRIHAARRQLLDVRRRRVPPATDDKVITAWNGLAISAFCTAYRAFGKERWRRQAIQSGNRLWNTVWKEGSGLFRIYRLGKVSVPAFLDDYALLGAAFLDLYEITFEAVWLDRAGQLMAYALQQFGQENAPLLYYQSGGGEKLIARTFQLRDNVIPSSNSVMARNLFRLGLLTGQEKYRARAEEMLSAALLAMEEGGDAESFAHWGQLGLQLSYPFYEIAIVGPDHAAKRKALQRNYLPQALFLGGTVEGKLPLLKGKAVAGKTLIYVCLEKVCQLPVEEPARARQQLIN